MDEAAARNWRPAARLDRAAHLQGEGVEALLPVAGLDPTFAGQAPQRAVGADVVEPVIVDADVREVRRHPIQRPGAAEIEEFALAGRVELQQRRAELEPL